MAEKTTKIDLSAKIDCDGSETNCSLIPDIFNLTDLEDKELNIQIRTTKSSQNLRETLCQSEAIDEKINKINAKLEEIHKELLRKNSPIHIEGQTVWITGFDGVDGIKTIDLQTMRKASCSGSKDLGMFSKEKNLELSKSPEIHEKSHQTISSSEKMSLDREGLSQLKAESSSGTIVLDGGSPGRIPPQHTDLLDKKSLQSFASN